MLPEQPLDVVGILVGHEPQVDLGPCPCRDDGRTSCALVTAGHPVEREGRTNGGPLVEGVARLPPTIVDLGGPQDRCVRWTRSSHGRPLAGIPRAYPVVEPWNGHARPGIVQVADDLAQRLDRIVHGPSELARVHVVPRS